MPRSVFQRGIDIPPVTGIIYKDHSSHGKAAENVKG